MYQKTFLINILTLALMVGWSGSMQARTSAKTISRAIQAVQKKTERKIASIETNIKEPAPRLGFFEIKFDGNFLVITRKDDLKVGYMAPCGTAISEGDLRENYGTAIGMEIQRKRTRSNPVGIAILSRGNLNDCLGLIGFSLQPDFCETATGIGLPQQGSLRGARGILSGFGNIQSGLAGLNPFGSGSQGSSGFGAQGSFGGGARDAFGNPGGQGSRNVLGLGEIGNAGLSLWEPCGGQTSQCGGEGGGGASGSISDTSNMIQDRSGWAMDGRSRRYEGDYQTDNGTYHVDFEEDDNGNYSVEVTGLRDGVRYLYANDGNLNGQREARREIQDATGTDLITQAEDEEERRRSAEAADSNARQSQPGSGSGQPAAGESEDSDDCSGDDAGTPECEPTDGGTEPGGTGDGDGDTYPACGDYYSEECGEGNTIVFPLPIPIDPIDQPYVDPAGNVINPTGEENPQGDPEDPSARSMDDPLGPWINPTDSGYGAGSAEGSEGAGCGGQGDFNGPAGYTDPAGDLLIQSSGDEESVVGIDPDDGDDGGDDEGPGS